VQAPRGVADGLNLVGSKRRGSPAPGSYSQRCGERFRCCAQRLRALSTTALTPHWREETGSITCAEIVDFVLAAHRSPFSDTGLMLALIAGAADLPINAVVSTLPIAPLVCAYEGPDAVEARSPIFGFRLSAWQPSGRASLGRRRSRGFVSVAPGSWRAPSFDRQSSIAATRIAFCCRWFQRRLPPRLVTVR